MLEVALFRPEIPPNTGNISRLCVGIGARLHIIDKPVFSMDDRHVRRAGLDYWDQLDLVQHENWDAFLKYIEGKGQRVVAVSKLGKIHHWDYAFAGSEIILMGSETNGLPKFVHDHFRENPLAGQVVRIPMRADFRSLNLSNATAIVVYEGLRQSRVGNFTIPAS